MMLLIILLNLWLCHATYAFNTTQCCPPNHVLLKGKKTTCWEPHSKNMNKIDLACNETFKFRSNYSVDEEGTLTITHLLTNQEGHDITIKYGEYCLGKLTTIKDVELTGVEDVIVMCLTQDLNVAQDAAKSYCLIISIIFLTLTALVYSFLRKLRDLLGKSIINFCVSSAIGLIIIIIMKLASYTDMNLCAARGFLAYFFVIASFFWMNAISIQILRSMSRPHVYDSGWKEFKWYVLYAWGCPAVLTLCMVIVNYHPGKHARPGIGLNHCWFLGKQQWYYMYSVMSILIIANIIIFVWMLTRLWCHSFNSTHVKVLRYKFMLSVRLFVLMGVPWIFEMISSLSTSSVIWTIIDIFNTLQGLLIFIVLVVLRRRALKLMYQQGWFCCFSEYVEKHLAIVDDEEDIAEHTVDVGLEDNIKISKNGAL